MCNGVESRRADKLDLPFHRDINGSGFVINET